MEELIHLTDLTNLPLSSIQKRLWILWQHSRLNPSYNLQIAYNFDGPVNLDILRKSVQILFDKQFTMYSVFRHREGIPYIVISPGQVEIELRDFSGFPAPERRNEILSFGADDSRRSFDIENGPLYRLYLLKEDAKSYFFYATIHHLVFDGYSRKVFVNELNRVYNDLIKGQEVKSEPLKYLSFDFARSDNPILSADKEQEMIDFWKENLQDCPPELKFPYDFNRKREPSGFGCKESFRISAEYTQKLRNISLEINSSLFNALFSALGLLLQKYTGENIVCIGVPVTTRRSSHSFKIFGAMINTVAVKLNIDGENDFISHIRYSTGVITKSIAHSAIPYEKIVEVVNPARMPGINPFFQIVFSWLNNFTESMNLGGVTGKRFTMEKGVAPSDITLYMWEDSGQLVGDIEYNADILTQETIVRLKENFISLVQTLADQPSLDINKISVLSPSERKMISEFNKTESALPVSLIQELFEEQVLNDPEKTAAISGNSHINYSELDRRANQLAHHLLSLKVKEGDVVGICIERSLEMIVSVLGVLKAGCTYLPLDPAFPNDRLKYIYDDSEAKVLISQSSLHEKLRHFPNAKIVLTDSDKEKISKNSELKPSLKITSQSLAYMMYTSGSTGRPKGVKVHHEAMVNIILSMSKTPGFLKTDRLLAVTTLSFDLSVVELFLPVSVGGLAVIAKSDEVADGQKLSNLLETHDISVMQATPITWTLLLASGWKGKKDLKCLCGGEAMTPGFINELLPKVGSLWNMYGPTETTVWSTCFRIPDIDSTILVGRPVDNTRIYILDSHNNPLPLGSTGEVCIGGLGVTKGYKNQPELTAEKFIPFENGKLIYKTGDLGRFLKDGNIELFGRIDKQLKLRGFRIEPGEIESLLTLLHGVREAVVKIHRFDSNDDRLVAFINADNGFTFTKKEITEYLSQHVPAYMIPSFFRVTDGFPRLPNGKINTKALLFEVQETDSKKDIDFDSFSPTEKKLVVIWENILKIKNIALTDNFFNIGGNSLLALNIFSKILSEFQIDLDLRIFFDTPRIKDLAETIDIKLNKDLKKETFGKREVSGSQIISGEI